MLPEKKSIPNPINKAGRKKDICFLRSANMPIKINPME